MLPAVSEELLDNEPALEALALEALVLEALALEALVLEALALEALALEALALFSVVVCVEKRDDAEELLDSVAESPREDC